MKARTDQQRQAASESGTGACAHGSSEAQQDSRLANSPALLAQRKRIVEAFGPAAQRETGAPPNRTGLPDALKTGIESLSGMDMSGVRVHANSSEPRQLNALAYAQGSDIHLGPGQEKHLPHEAWHLVQQRQGRVQPTTRVGGVNVNDDAGLEKEADTMGAKALQCQVPRGVKTVPSLATQLMNAENVHDDDEDNGMLSDSDGAGISVGHQGAMDRLIQHSPRIAAQRQQLRQAFGPVAGVPVQAKMGFELETNNKADQWKNGRWEPYGRKKDYPIYRGEGFVVETDTHNNPEFIFDAQNDRAALSAAADKAVDFCTKMNGVYKKKKGAFADGRKEDSFKDDGDAGWQGDFRLHVNDDKWLADGQMTMGVKLEDIPKYIGHVLPRAKKREFEKMRKTVADDKRSAKVDGLLSLMIQFVSDFKTWKGQDNEEGPKNAQAYMNRNSFDKMLKSMAQEQQTEFKALFYGPDDAWKAANPITTATGVNETARVIPNPYLDADEDRVNNATTLKGWVDSIFAAAAIDDEDDYDTDLMSPPQGWRGGNYGMGLLDMDTESVADTSLALFEYRHTDNREDMGETEGKSLSVYEWASWMEERFDKAQAWNETLKDPKPAQGDDAGEGEADGGGEGEGQVQVGAQADAQGGDAVAQTRAQGAGGVTRAAPSMGGGLAGGLPAQLQSGIERLSGLAMDDVKVHYNSAQPAQMQALAYAQGPDIHVGPGQERHLPHEAWHVVQQKLGRVRPTMQMAGTAVNDDPALEAEADTMGAKALNPATATAAPLQTRAAGASAAAAQRMVGYEIDVESHAFAKGEQFLKSDKWDFKKDLLKLQDYGITLQFDAGTLELILPPIQEPGGVGELEHLFDGIGVVFQVLSRVAEAIDFIHEDDESTDQVGIEYPADAPFKRDPTDEEDTTGDGSTLSDLQVRRTPHGVDQPVFGDLQSTVGIKFSAIGALADVLTGSDALRSSSVNEQYGEHSWDPKTTYRNRQQRNLVATASARVLSWTARNTRLTYEDAEEIMGFLTILATYLLCSKDAQDQGTKLQDAKGIAPLMSRVSLGAVWEELNKKFTGLTADMVLAMAGVEDGPLYGDSVDDEYDFNNPAERYNLNETPYTRITRKEWLTALIVEKRDLLSGLGDSISEVEPVDKKPVGTPNRTTANFKMSNAVDIGKGRQGMVLELRRLPRHLDYQGLKQLAFKIYYLVEAGNKLAP